MYFVKETGYEITKSNLDWILTRFPVAFAFRLSVEEKKIRAFID